jgi:flagellar biosynthesis GTPase FlhF
VNTPTPDAKTFRGKSLEEVLPQIRAELGADAIVLRRREGLAGGVGGFFQRPFVEVEARSALPDEVPLEARNDRATAEGLASPVIQALVGQAAPFADALSRAENTLEERAGEVLRDATPIVPAGLYGPQPNAAAIVAPEAGAAGDPAAIVAPDVADEDDDLFAPEPEAPAPKAAIGPIGAPGRGSASSRPIGVDAPAAAAKAEQRLVASGLSAALAADVVGEAVAHGLPFAQPRALKKLIRSTLARRIPAMADLGPGARRLAFVGAGGAGKSLAISHLAAAYAAADYEVVVVALGARDGGIALANRLEPLGVSVIAAADGEQAARRLARREADLLLIDTPSAGPGDRAAVTRLTADLRALDVEEIHLTLPATLSAAAADELAATLAPVGLTHVALTHADQTARPGAPVELAITARKALSYICERESAEPADPIALASVLLP